MKVEFRIASTARVEGLDNLVLEAWKSAALPVWVEVSPNATLRIERPFVVGAGTTIAVDSGASLVVGGRKEESASGITANGTILVAQELVIGADALIAPDVFITDSDWHSIGGRDFSTPTEIGRHVWIAHGAKVLRGAVVGDNCIVAAGAVVRGGVYPDRSLLAGVPAVVRSRDIPDWKR